MKIGIIGCGKQAEKHIIGFYKNQIKNIVLYDKCQFRAEQLSQKYGCSFVSSIQDILQDQSVVAVSICTPASSHKSLIVSSLESGKHFFCEKPLTENYSDDVFVSQLAKNKSRIGMVGYIYRFCPILDKIKNLLSSDVLGRLHTACFRLSGRGSHMLWKHRRNLGGGALNEMAVHMIDIVYWYFGRINSVELLDVDMRLPIRIIGDERVVCDAEDYVVLNLISHSGVKILLVADFITPEFCQYVEVKGENGCVRGSIQPDFSNNLFLLEDRLDYKKGNNLLVAKTVNLYEKQLGHFIESINNGKQPAKGNLLDSNYVMKLHSSLKKKMNLTFIE